MIRYPNFNARVGGSDLVELARRTGVSVELIEAALAGDHALGLAERYRLLEELEPDATRLFWLSTDAMAALDDVVRQGKPRRATDAAALRALS